MANVGVRYTQFSTTRLKTVRTCEHCRAQQSVEVLGVGHGSGDASHLLGNYEAAQSRAASAAADDAERQAQLMLGLVHCPKCGLRSATVTRRFVSTHESPTKRTRWLSG